MNIVLLFRNRSLLMQSFSEFCKSQHGFAVQMAHTELHRDGVAIRFMLREDIERHRMIQAAVIVEVEDLLSQPSPEWLCRIRG